MEDLGIQGFLEDLRIFVGFRICFGWIGRHSWVFVSWWVVIVKEWWRKAEILTASNGKPVAVYW